MSGHIFDTSFYCNYLRKYLSLFFLPFVVNIYKVHYFQYIYKNKKNS